MTPILPQAEELLSILKQLMPTMYQQETLESILALLLQGQGHSLPHHCLTKSESAISRFRMALSMVYSFSDSYCSLNYPEFSSSPEKKRSKTYSPGYA